MAGFQSILLKYLQIVVNQIKVEDRSDERAMELMQSSLLGKSDRGTQWFVLATF
jgi:hypothetical protein